MVRRFSIQTFTDVARSPGICCEWRSYKANEKHDTEYYFVLRVSIYAAYIWARHFGLKSREWIVTACENVSTLSKSLACVAIIKPRLLFRIQNHIPVSDQLACPGELKGVKDGRPTTKIHSWLQNDRLECIFLWPVNLLTSDWRFRTACSQMHVPR